MSVQDEAFGVLKCSERPCARNRPRVTEGQEKKANKLALKCLCLILTICTSADLYRLGCSTEGICIT